MFRFLFTQEINCMNLNMIVSFFIKYAWRTINYLLIDSNMLERQFIISYFFFANDGGDNAYGVKKKWKNLIFLSVEKMRRQLIVKHNQMLPNDIYCDFFMSCNCVLWIISIWMFFISLLMFWFIYINTWVLCSILPY